MFVAPAEHLAGTEVPADWVDRQNRPKSFTIDFVHGQATVDDRIGRYLVEHKLAFRTALVMPGYFNGAR